MPAPIRALLVDDDDFFRRAFRLKLLAKFPEIDLTERADPDVSGSYDVYFLDNQFGDVPLAGELIGRVRATNPRALVVALSARLDADTLKRLINEGCNGACEKGNPAELERTFDIVRSFAQASARPAERGGLGGTIRSIAELIREWNARLVKNNPAAVG